MPAHLGAKLYENSIWITGYGPFVDHLKLKELFSKQCGSVKDVKIYEPQKSADGKVFEKQFARKLIAITRGIALIEFESDVAVKKALGNDLSNIEVGGNSIGIFKNLKHIYDKFEIKKKTEQFVDVNTKTIS